MCLINVKDEDDYSVPARRPQRRQPSPVRSVRRSIVVERRSENFGPLPASIPPPSRISIPAPSTYVPPREERRSSRPPSRAPSVRGTRSAYVEVDEETSSSSESSRHTSHTKKTSKSRRTAPASEYSIHEKETRRERGYSRPPRDEFETYRYVESPRNRDRNSGARSSYHEQPRSSKDDYGRRITIEDEYRKREYR